MSFSIPFWHNGNLLVMWIAVSVSMNCVVDVCAFFTPHGQRVLRCTVLGEKSHAEENDAFNSQKENFLQRRTFLRTSAFYVSGGVSLFCPVPVWSVSESKYIPNDQEKQYTKPFAPTEALLPAIRVRTTIDWSLAVAKEIQSHPNDNQHNEQLQKKLESKLLSPQNYVRNVLSNDGGLSHGDAVGFSPLSMPTLAQQKYQPAKAYLDTYNRNRQDLPLMFQPGALLVQSGEIDSWRRLKRQEAKRETQDEIRAALNVYNQALTYRADAYLLTVSSQERSQMVRQDKLPDVKQVIASDMGMRYLYRNQLLTSMSEVKAELEYQRNRQEKDGSNDIDVSELVPLLQDAQNACEQWFSLIEPDEINAAMGEFWKDELVR